MTTAESLIMIAVCAIATFLTRWLPFALFPKDKPTPKYILYLGKVLPFAITGMLVVYCLKDISVLAYPYGIPEIIGVATVAILYKLFKNSLVAIGVSTVLYMVLVQVIFV